MAEWTADEAYVMESSGVFCSISGRQYTKVNEGKALVSSFYINSGYTCPLIVSTEQDAVVYSALGKSFSYKTTVEYLGVTWYASNDEYFDRKVSTGNEITRDDMLSYVSRVNQLVQVSNRFDEIVKDFFKIKYKVILKDSMLNTATLNESNVASQLDREALEIEEEFVKSIYPDDAYKTDIIRNFVNSDYRKFTYVAVILSAYANLKQAIDRYSIKEDS